MITNDCKILNMCVLAAAYQKIKDNSIKTPNDVLLELLLDCLDKELDYLKDKYPKIYKVIESGSDMNPFGVWNECKCKKCQKNMDKYTTPLFELNLRK